jgi:hypothetical protein
MTEMKPTINLSVHYVSRGSADGVYPPTCRAATVTEVDEHDPARVGLAVLNPTGLFFHPLADDGGCEHYEPPQGVRGYRPGTWHHLCGA